MVEWLFLAVPWGCLRFVIVVFPSYTHYFLSKYMGDVCSIKIETQVVRLHKIWVKKAALFLANKYAVHGF